MMVHPPEDLHAAIARRAITTGVLVEVRDERERQVGLGYDVAHDDEHGLHHPVRLAYDRLGWIGLKTPDRRAELVKVAALVVAAIEALDRGVSRETSGGA